MASEFDEILTEVFAELRVTTTHQGILHQNGITIASVMVTMSVDEFIEMGLPPIAAKKVFAETVVPLTRHLIEGGAIHTYAGRRSSFSMTGQASFADRPEA